MLRFALLVWLALLGVGCAGTRVAKDKTAPDPVAAPGAPAVAPAWSPFNESGWRGGEIPAILLQAVDAPYARPEPPTCAHLAAAITELDAVLGEDLDSAVAKPDQENWALYALGSGIRGLIPYYGWIRRLSGADRQQRRALAAVAAGTARRGYLKGLGEARACPSPARPARRPAAP